MSNHEDFEIHGNYLGDVMVFHAGCKCSLGFVENVSEVMTMISDHDCPGCKS